jgi:hypothetical protein
VYTFSTILNIDLKHLIIKATLSVEISAALRPEKGVRVLVVPATRIGSRTIVLPGKRLSVLVLVLPVLQVLGLRTTIRFLVWRQQVEENLDICIYRYIYIFHL